MGRGRGAVSKLTTPVREKLLERLREGNYYVTACASVGLNYATFRSWIMAGEAATSGIYYDFVVDVRRAEAEAEAAIVSKLRLAGERDWRANLEFIARRWPNRWGSTNSIRVEQAGEVKVTHEHFLTTVVAIPEIAERVAEAFRIDTYRGALPSPSEE